MKFSSDRQYLQQLIAQGEHQQQDFKYKVMDAEKLARSVSAFANTDGGRLLIGVRDDGHISGIRSEEEIYMMHSCRLQVLRAPALHPLRHPACRGPQRGDSHRAAIAPETRSP